MKNQFLACMAGIGALFATTAHAATHECVTEGVRGCNYSITVTLDQPNLIQSFRIWARCENEPDTVFELGSGGNIAASPNFRPRFDSRFVGWKQFSIEPLINLERASLLINPATLNAQLEAHLRLVVPGNPASEALDLQCQAL